MDEGKVRDELARLRAERSRRKLAVETGENAGLALCLLPGGRSRLLVDMDMLAVDVAGLCTVLHDLARAYAGEALCADCAEDWARAMRHDPADEARARAYWTERLPSLPGGPELPLAKRPEDIARTATTRRRRHLNAETWSALAKGAASCGATMVALLLTAYAEVLSRWSGQTRFLVNLPLSNRQGQTGTAGEYTGVELLEAALDPKAGFASHLAAVSARLYEDLDCRAWSGVRILRELARRDQAAPVVFAGNVDTVLLSREDEAVLGKVAWMISQTPQVWLDFQLYADGGGGQILVWDAVEELFPEGMLDAMFEALGGLLENLARLAPGAAGGAWDALPADIMPVALMDASPAPAIVVPEERASSLHGPVFSQASLNPGRTALVDAEGHAAESFGTLASRALAVARAVRDAGAGEGDLVAVTLPRGMGQVEAMLGVLASGAAYAPVSIDQPYLRRKSIHERAGIRLAVTDAGHAASLQWPEGCRLLDLAKALKEAPLEAPAEPGPDSLAYVIFTSGSTGEPKGVEISHQGAANTVQAVSRLCGIGPGDRGVAVSSADFDLSVYDVFGMLGAGASLCVLPEAARRDASAWAKACEALKPTVWNSVPMLADMLATAAAMDGRDISSLRVFMLSGDWIPLSLPARLRSLCPNCAIAAMGGATEASIWSNIFWVEPPLPAGWASVPYGRALPGQCWRIVDEAGRDCPAWTPGELWIGGRGLALGYRADPERTAASFVESRGGRWYRTGDMGRFWPDGTMEFLGRRDWQVKFHGHRIELGEISSALRRHPAVREAAVCVVPDPAGRQQLAGYLVPSGTEPVPGAAELASFLRERVPGYMVVNHYCVLESLPLTANGKVDRKRLPLPDFGQEDDGAAGRELSPVERKVAALWEELLGIPAAGAGTNFFEAGGDSLLAIRLASSLRRAFSIPFGTDAVLRSPTVAGIAALVEERLGDEGAPASRDAGLPRVEPRPDLLHEPFPLTAVQQAYVIGRSGAFELGGVAARYLCELEGRDLDLNLLAEAWNALVARHPMMRAVVTQDGRQRVLEQVPAYRPAVRHLEAVAEDRIAEELARLRQDQAQARRSASEWPLFEVSFTRLQAGRTRIHLAFDNVMFDGRSVFLLLDQWGATYAALARGEALPAPSLLPQGLTFRDYVCASRDLQASPLAEADRAYWTARLDAIWPAPDLPLRQDPSAVASNAFVRRSMELSEKDSERLRAMAASRGLTLSGCLLAAYAEVLARWAAQPKFTVNLTLFNRVPFAPEVASLVGDFTALTLLACDMGAGASFAERAQALQRQLWSDLAHPHFGGLEVMRELSQRRGQVRMPVVFTSGLGIEAGRGAASLGRLDYAITQTPQVWLDHQVSRQNGRLVLAWDAVEALFQPEMLDAMFASYEGLVRSLLEDATWDEARPEHVDAEICAAQANATQAVKPAGTLLSALEDSVRLHAPSPAVIAPDRTLSYADLWRLAGILRAELKELAPGSLVAIVMEKGWEQAAASAAVVSAGCAWLPMEADVPLARMEAVFGEAGVTTVLTHAACIGRTWPQGLRVVDCSAAIRNFPDGAEPEAPLAWPAPDQVAYVIYTSGSTGRPKGVAISHEAVMNTLADVNRRFGVGSQDRIFGISHFSFDLSVYDFWGAFLAGAACILPEHGTDRDPSRWAPLLEMHGVTVWNSVPALMQMLAGWLRACGRRFPASLRVAMLSGDWIPLSLPAELAQAGSLARLYSLGGATEASIWSIFHPVDKVDPAWKSIPYGRPLANQRFHVLDPLGLERPVGCPGELCIAGDGLALGYWHDPERTAQSFVAMPDGRRLYRTGDLGLRFADGTLGFLGRTDFQVKLRGFRIELGEVEHAALGAGGVEDAVCVMTGETAQDKRLCLAVVAPGRQEDGDALAGEVLARCRTLLPG
ncbi:MAG: amino acid adenylation domain-containing protein, partial [Desulfovibrio sp.]|nr:amino acid adenylation domain-containing protein [Desulfovibrio sp.]